jgi:hypothetical protein
MKLILAVFWALALTMATAAEVTNKAPAGTFITKAGYYQVDASTFLGVRINRKSTNLHNSWLELSRIGGSSGGEYYLTPGWKIFVEEPGRTWIYTGKGPHKPTATAVLYTLDVQREAHGNSETTRIGSDHHGWESCPETLKRAIPESERQALSSKKP